MQWFENAGIYLVRSFNYYKDNVWFHGLHANESLNVEIIEWGETGDFRRALWWNVEEKMNALKLINAIYITDLDKMLGC